MGLHLLPPAPGHAALTATLASSRPPNNSGSKLCLPSSRCLRMRTGTPRLRLICCTADRPIDPGPDEDNRMTWPKKIWEIDEYSEEYAAKLDLYGLYEDSTIKDMFCDERQKIEDTFWKRLASSGPKHREATMKSLRFCRVAWEALGLSSRVMRCAFSRLRHPTQISLGTIEQSVRTYVSIFVKLAEDTFNGKIKKGIIISALDALEGLAAISHLLLQDTVDAVNYISLENGSTKYSSDQDVDVIHNDYQKEMSSLKQNIVREDDSAVEIWNEASLSLPEANGSDDGTTVATVS
ncbi:hypothetical protein U9M48_029715 [Paspalum notatum var. saurae]|uniref:Uncharacterized protein n=1 Tax=Paspalum notatum var. saurae TaxID=547442 RepID=A0AAQ3TZ19_PASNO